MLVGNLELYVKEGDISGIFSDGFEDDPLVFDIFGLFVGEV